MAIVMMEAPEEQGAGRRGAQVAPLAFGAAGFGSRLWATGRLSRDRGDVECGGCVPGPHRVPVLKAPPEGAAGSFELVEVNPCLDPDGRMVRAMIVAASEALNPAAGIGQRSAA